MTQSSTAPTDLIAAATDTLLAGGYKRIGTGFPDWETSTSRLFEDPYNVVGVVVFDTCEELLMSWPEMQGRLVDIISRYVGQGEAKSWDGYLVLLTPAMAPSEENNLEAIRYDTARLRKIVATGDDVRTPSDVGRVLRPLLPLSHDANSRGSAAIFDLLPALLKEHGVSENTSKTLIEAFRSQGAILEALHAQEGE